MKSSQIDPQNLYRLSLSEVKPLLYANAMTVFSGIQIEATPQKTACTNGKTVFLPEFKNYFPDCKSELAKNRNATMYLSDLLHEVGYHICAGSFLVDSEPTLKRFPNQVLAHAIFNILEDYRGRQHFRAHCPVDHWIELVDEEERFFVSRFKFFFYRKSDFLSLLIAKGVYGFTPGDILPDRKADEEKLLQKKCTLYGMPSVTPRSISLQSVLKKLVKRIRRLKGKTVADSLLMIDEIYLTLIQVLGDDFMSDQDLENSHELSQHGNQKTGNKSKPSKEKPGDDSAQNGTPGENQSASSTEDKDLNDGDGRNNKDSENESESPDDQKQAPNFDHISDLGVFPGKDVFKSSKKASKAGRKQQLVEFSSFIMPFQKALNIPGNIKNKTLTSAVTNGPNQGPSSSKKPQLNVTTKIYEGNYDYLRRRRDRSTHQIILKKESRYHDQFNIYHKEYREVFNTMEEEVLRLLHKQESVVVEGRTPEEFIMENLVDGIADPAAIPHIDLYENESQFTKQLLGRMEVKILVDASGSTAGAILEKEKVFAAVLYKAFKAIDADVELFFFNTSTATQITQTLNLDSIGWVDAASSNRDGSAIRFITERFNKNADQNLLIVISDGLPSADNYSGPAALEDTLDAMYGAAQKNISMRYFNIGGMPDTIFDAFRKYTKNPQIFIDPEELIAYAPVFINELISEMHQS